MFVALTPTSIPGISICSLFVLSAYSCMHFHKHSTITENDLGFDDFEAPSSL